MKRETQALLDVARRDIADARGALAAGLIRMAARQSYVAAFTAARALVMERDGQSPKTHHGVHALFARACSEPGGVGASHSSFLSRAFKFKRIADYADEPAEDVPFAEARAAVEHAAALLDAVVRALTPDQR